MKKSVSVIVAPSSLSVHRQCGLGLLVGVSLPVVAAVGVPAGVTVPGSPESR